MINLSEDRILDFLDGRLASPDEEELLHTLSVSPERRQVMREHMKLREVTSSIARQDKLTVPEYVTDQLFSKLEGMGYTAPVSTEALLSRTPEYVSVAGAAAVATAVGSGWRIGMISLLTASVMSFILGAGAYYVFGSSLGLRTHSQELADAKRHVISRHYAAVNTITAPQYDLAEAQPVSHGVANVISNLTKALRGNGSNIGNGSDAGSSNVAAPVEAGIIGPLNVGQPANISNDNGSANPSDAIGSNGSATDAGANSAVTDGGLQISYTPPVKATYAASVTAPQPLTDLLPFWPSVVPSPLEQSRGMISFQLGSGPGPSSTTVQWNKLAEFKFSFTLWDYFAGAASMGDLWSFERMAQAASVPSTAKSGSSNYSTAYVINTNTTQETTITLMGLEGGITLDHAGVPLTAMVGFLSGPGSPLYKRGSLMMHFDPLSNMTVSAGIEGIFYNHDLTSSIATQEKYNSPYPTSVAPSAVTSEVCGLVGPSIEIGWHF